MGNLPTQKSITRSPMTKKVNTMQIEKQKPNSVKNSTRPSRVYSYNATAMNFNPPMIANSSTKNVLTTRRLSRHQLNMNIPKTPNIPDNTNNKITDKTEIKFITNTLKLHYLFTPYIEPEYIKTKLIKQMKRLILKPDMILYQKGDNPEAMYILYKGKLTITNNNTHIIIYNNEYEDNECDNEINEGKVFGESDIINNTTRQHDIINQSKIDCIIIVIPQTLLLSITETIRKQNKSKLDTFFNTHYPFISSYDSIKRNIINNSITIMNFNENDIIPYEGNCIYIINKGEISIIHNNEITKNLRTGNIIGHRELIFPILPNITLQSKTQNEIFHISHDALSFILGKNNVISNISFFLFALCFYSSKYLTVIDIATLLKIFPLFSIENYDTNEIAFSKGDCLNEEVIIIIEGNVSKLNGTHYEAVRGEFLYEKELITNEHSVLIIEDLHMYPEGIIMKCDNEKIKKVLNGCTLKDLVNKNVKKKTCYNLTIELLKRCGIRNINIVISKIKINEMEKAIDIVKFSSNVTIIKEGDTNLDLIYFIINGYVGIYINNKLIRTLGPGSPFGYKAMLNILPKRTATAITHGPCEILSITGKVFMSILMNDTTIPQMSAYLKGRVCLEDEMLSLNDIENIRLLGKGSFGFVNLVRHKKQKCLYAIKAIPVIKVVQYNIYELISNEKNILKMLDHNFLMKNVISLKNNEFVFLINEYIRGKTLSRLLKDSGPFTKQQAQFYIASLIIVIQYLHSNHFIHRDIKPENVMVNSNGYIKLIDFGTVKETSSKNGNALTIIGTPHYMAPEVMKGIAYNCSVDYWSVGVCLYEFIFGKVPFAPEHKDPNEIYKAINNYIDCKTNIRFPSGYKDVELINLLNGMLARDCNKRIKYNELMKHKWFEGFDWKELVEMNLNVPYKPGGSDLDDLNCKGSNYMTALKTLMFNNSNNNSNKHKELTKWDYEKGEKWLKEF